MRTDKPFVRGMTADEKFGSIEIALKHLSMRTKDVVTAVISPNQISAYCRLVTPEDLAFFRYMFSVAGKLALVTIFVEEMSDKQPPTVIAFLNSGGTISSVDFKLKNQSLQATIDVAVKVGDRLTLYVDDATKASGIWVGFKFIPNYDASINTSVMIDSLTSEE